MHLALTGPSVRRKRHKSVMNSAMNSIFLPTLLLRFLVWVPGRDPQVQKKYGGTVGLTAVGMFGEGAFPLDKLIILVIILI